MDHSQQMHKLYQKLEQIEVYQRTLGKLQFDLECCAPPMGMAQAGQYNLLRSLKRGETATAMLAAARFSEQAVSMTFLLNKRYMPFYKWAHRGVEQLPILGRETAACVTALAGLDWRLGPRVEAVAGDIVESLCRDVAGRLRSDGLSDADGDWLVEHGPSVQARIETPELQRMSVMLE